MADNDNRFGVFLPAALLLAAITLSGGAALAGWFVSEGLREHGTADRYVSVKGISEREVKADLAIWPLAFVVGGDDLVDVQRELDRNAGLIADFLTGAGFAEAEIEPQDLRVTDRQAQVYNSGPLSGPRFIASRTIVLRSTAVDDVAALSGRLGQLVSQGVVLGNDPNNYSPTTGPSFLFTELTGIKPEMIAEATANARQGAEQFAADSGAAVGGIRRANQGVFQILPRDDAPGIYEPAQLHKKIRVVSTIDFYLED